jgi:hypothetical protein
MAPGLDHHVRGDGIEIGADAPLGEGQRIVRVPGSALIVRDAEMALAALRIGAALGSPAEPAGTHRGAL